MYNIRTKPYDLLEVTGCRDNNHRKLVGKALPFSGRSYGFTLLFDNKLKLVMYPAKDYSPRRKKFDVMSLDEQGDTKHRTKVGEGWRIRYGAGFDLKVNFEGIVMRLQLRPSAPKKKD